MGPEQQSQHAQINTEYVQSPLNEQPQVRPQRNSKAKYVVVCILLLLVVILGGFYYLKIMKTQPIPQKNSLTHNVTTSPIPTNTITAKTPPTIVTEITQETNNLYTGWKQYCSKLEKSCFKYPPNWSIHTEEFINPADYALLTSPLGDRLAFNSPANGLDDNGCSPTQHAYIYKVIPNPNVANMYIVEYGEKDSNNISIALIDPESALQNGIAGKIPVAGDTGQCVLEPLFKTRNAPHPSVSSFNSFSLEQNDIPTAELILKSYTY